MQLHLKVQAADTTALKSESFALLVPSYENLLELPPPKAMLAKFPPGALVLLTDVSTYPLVVSKGTVEAVFIDLSPEKLTREYVFRVRLDNDKTTIMAVETQLQWAPTLSSVVEIIAQTANPSLPLSLGAVRSLLTRNHTILFKWLMELEYFMVLVQTISATDRLIRRSSCSQTRD